MMKFVKPQKLSLLFTLILIISIIVITTSFIFTVIIVNYRTIDLIELADSKLFTAAELNREIIGTDYHDRIKDKSSVPEDKFLRIVEKNDDLCRRLHLQYLWSVLCTSDGIVFTSAAHSDLNDPGSSRASFFDRHHDPEAFTPALNPELKPVYSSFKNEWGEGRMILIPRKDIHGRTYIFGASIQLAELTNTINSSIINSIGIGLGIIGITFIFAIILARAFTSPIAKLVSAAGRMAVGDLDTSIPSAGIRELYSLSSSLEQMRLGFRQHIKALREGEEKYKRLFESMMDAFVLIDMEGHILEFNQSYRLMLGYSEEELYSLSISDITPAVWIEFEAGIINNQIVPLGYSEIYRKEYRRKNGDVFPVELRTFLLQNESGEPAGMWAIVRDIAERKLAEENILNLLNEKELILKEVHHRIKNNMNIISGLLILQAETQDNVEIKHILLDAVGRVQSMMILYDKLYRSEITGKLSLKEYLPTLIKEIVHLFPLHASVKISTQIDDIALDSKMLPLIGVIINELITNSMKYAFTYRSDGVISVTASKNGNRMILIFEDNGSGIPESVTLENVSGFGMQLINMLIEQMDGTIKIVRNNGTKIVMEVNV